MNLILWVTDNVESFGRHMNMLNEKKLLMGRGWSGGGETNALLYNILIPFISNNKAQVLCKLYCID